MKLNIGAGQTRIPGFIPIDRKLGSEAFPLSEYVTNDGEACRFLGEVPPIGVHHITDNSVDEIRASHVLEHFGFVEARAALREWVRVLKPGGTIKIAVPDFDKITKLRADPLWSRWLMGGQTDEDDYHKSLFTEKALEEEMRLAGLSSIRFWSSDNTDTASSPCSLNLQGIKSDNPPEPECAIDVVEEGVEVDDKSILVNAVCCMSIPRVGFNDHWGCVTDVLGPLGIPVVRFTGAFWGHGMQAMFLKAVEDGADWIISVDYDSMFSKVHLTSMLSMMGRHPEIDALTCVQARRNHDNVMLTRSVNGKKQRGVEIDGGPIQCDTAHFGLTIFRATAFKDLPLPWFNDIPGPDGRWDHDEHIDDDVYFWKHWKKHDRTLFVNPNVRIGHLELMVSGFDIEFHHQIQSVPDWRKENL